MISSENYKFYDVCGMDDPFLAGEVSTTERKKKFLGNFERIHGNTKKQSLGSIRIFGNTETLVLSTLQVRNYQLGTQL